MPKARSSVGRVITTGEAITGLDYDGTAPGRRMVLFSSPPASNPLTFLVKVYQRNQVSNRTDTSRYCTTFFWGNNGDFVWDGSQYVRSFYGMHPWPGGTSGTNPPADVLVWEISVEAQDKTLKDDGTRPQVIYNAWYNQALLVNGSGGRNYKAYLNLPDVSTQWTITYASGTDMTVPPSPSIVMGQAPKLAADANKSWGGYDGWEEQNAIIRGVQIFSSSLSQADIVGLSACNTNAEALAYASAHSITHWYLNMNPTPTDISDKSGSGHHPTWDGASRPALWTGP